VTAADNEGGGQQRHTRLGGGLRGGRRRTGGKQQWQDKRLISLPGREREKIKKSSFRKKTFFSDMVSPVTFFAPVKTANVLFLLYQSYLTWQLNKEDLDLCTLVFSCFLCPVFYSTSHCETMQDKYMTFHAIPGFRLATLFS
jgi:hypothetical protein